MDQDLLNLAFTQPKANVKPHWYEDFLDDPSNYYRTYYIPKTELRKKLDRGYKLPYPRNRIPASERHLWRQICAPVDILKEVQGSIRDMLYSRSPSVIDHCIRGKNRYTAMRDHAGQKIIIAMDIKDAFPSVSKLMIRHMLISEGFEEEIVELICNLSTLNNQLPQGSPCSPVILNLVRKTLDNRLRSYLESRFADSKTTVYVDNYFISSNNNMMNECIPVLKEIARTEGFIINNRKIYIMRKGRKMGGLGLVVSKQDNGRTTVQPDKKYRDRIRAILHQAKLRVERGEQPQVDFDIPKVRGMIETLKGTVYHGRYRNQFEHIISLLKAKNIPRIYVIADDVIQGVADELV